MGTRHLICIVAGGSYKLAQYGQWDGYPSGQGASILAFLSGEGAIDRLRAKLYQIKPVDDESILKFYEKASISVTKEGMVSYEDGKKFGEKYPSLSRDTGAKIFQVIDATGDDIPTRLFVEFAADSLFCEFAYVVDLDAGTFEVFKGFNKTPLSEGERFFPQARDGEEYQPVKLMKSYPLNALPTQEQFLADLEPEDDEEEEAA